ncbi:GAF domain-containing protein [Microvirga aerilata]|uniref:GAF domain-containing protein n=1 Tax=Microvirga aerilata TaxID=670292 RepID=A0A936ZBW3_9HYPH|nr:GAF domain-containing protein [Microvirga aerilata]MBL0407182.1 GAF domain-containing protein [Microvirga aerilata]
MIEQDFLSNPKRLAALRQANLLDTPPEEAFDQLTRIAAQLTNSPMAMVTIIDANRQFMKSGVGSIGPTSPERDIPLSHSFCRHAVTSKQPLIVSDARTDANFNDNPALTDFGVIAYAGIPLVSQEGEALGALCVIDSKPREWSDEQIDTLRSLATTVMSLITYRSAASGSAPSLGETTPLAPWTSRLLSAVSEHVQALDGYDECIGQVEGYPEMLEREKQRRETVVETELHIKQAMEEALQHLEARAADPGYEHIAKLAGATNLYLQAKARRFDVARQFQALQVSLDRLHTETASVFQAEQELRNALADVQALQE